MKFVDPLNTYRALHAQAPVVKMEALSGWLVTGYAECLTVFKNPAAFASARMDRVLRQGFADYTPELYPHLARLYSRPVLFLDPPEHGAARARIRPLFTPEKIEVLRERSTELLDTILSTASGRGTIDLQRDVADVLPLAVVADAVGLPPANLTSLGESLREIALLPGPAARPLERGEQRLRQLIESLEPWIKSKESRIFWSAEDQDGEFFEPVYRLIQMLIAGSLTALDMIGVGFLAFLEHPEQRQKFLEQPELQHNAIDEILRYSSPAQLVHRITTRDIELAGAQIKTGDLVYPVIAAANRDPIMFPGPDTFDIERANANRQIAFGVGTHTCPGAGLARMLAGMIFPRVFQRFPDIKIFDEPVWRTDGLAGRGLRALPVSL